MEFFLGLNQATLDTIFGILLTTVVCVSRMFGFVAIFPLFTWLNATGILRFVIVIGLGLPMLAAQSPSFGQQLVARIDLAILLMLKEVVLGALIGIIAGVPVWVATTAGDVIDSYRGASASNAIDPVNAIETTTFGQMNNVLASTWIAISGALPLVIEAVYASYRAWPVGEVLPQMHSDLLTICGEIASTIAKSGLIIAGPALTIMLLVESTLLFITTSAKGLPIFDLSVTAKNFALILVLPVYTFFFATYMRQDFQANYELIFSWIGLVAHR